MKILLTGFDPFGGETINPSWEAVCRTSAPEGVELVKLQVPTVFGTSVEVVAEAVRREKPDAVVCVGQAGGRTAVTPERVAVNCMDASIGDNRGFIPKDVPVREGGPDGLLSTLPVKAMVEAVCRAGVPCQLSNTAGTFVCNQLMYGVLLLCREEFPDTGAGFIHLPFLPQQTARKPGYASMSLGDMVTALEAALGAIRDHN